MPRRGYMLVELIVAIAILTAVSGVLSSLFQTLLADVPRNFRAFNSERTVQALLGRMQSDMNKARLLPSSAGKKTAGDDMLLISLPEGTVAYSKREGRIVRFALKDETTDPNSPRSYEMFFFIPRARVNWQVWRKNERGYALEVRTAIEPKFAGGVRRILANSHVFFMK